MIMISACSRCRTNYNIDESKIQGGRVLLHCPVCGIWFSVAVRLEHVQTSFEAAGASEEPTTLDDSTVDSEALAADTVQESEQPDSTFMTMELPLDDFKDDFKDDLKPDRLRLLVADAPNQF